jgi:crotonobetainyl-CoA:carnitine CoA-transferase CaiB-like acyl-CoA transferase
MNGPLSGIRVIDLTQMYSGPIATAILGDQGADVIKVEPPHGDPMRHTLPERNGLSAAFALMNRNKRSLALDLRTDDGRDVLLAMIHDADVLVQNFRPGVMDRLGIGYDVLAKANPRLIYTSITGMGSTGPYANRRTYDSVIQAMTGIADLHRDRATGRPTLLNTLICDKVTSLTAAQSIAAALFARERTGKGQQVEVSMVDANLFFLWPDSMSNETFIGAGFVRQPYGGHGSLLRKTADGYVAVLLVQQKEFEAVFRALDRTDLLNDPRFNSPEGRRAHGIALNDELKKSYAEFTTDEVCQRLEREDVPYGRINAREDVPDDPQIRAMNALPEVDHPVGGRMRQPRPPGLFSATPAELMRPSPGLSEHADAILHELGFTAEAIDGLRERGIIR